MATIDDDYESVRLPIQPLHWSEAPDGVREAWRRYQSIRTATHDAAVILPALIELHQAARAAGLDYTPDIIEDRHRIVVTHTYRPDGGKYWRTIEVTLLRSPYYDGTDEIAHLRGRDAIADAANIGQAISGGEPLTNSQIAELISGTAHEAGYVTIEHRYERIDNNHIVRLSRAEAEALPRHY